MAQLLVSLYNALFLFRQHIRENSLPPPAPIHQSLIRTLQLQITLLIEIHIKLLAFHNNRILLIIIPIIKNPDLFAKILHRFRVLASPNNTIIILYITHSLISESRICLTTFSIPLTNS
jgi:hypothetical protein